MTARVFASFSPDADRPMVMIYGNPEGLKGLALKLIEYAEFQQRETGHDPREHWHLFPGNHGSLRESLEIMVSRMDDRQTGETTWCEMLLDDMQRSLRKQISQLED
jgi:hypothetical protein